MKRIIIIGLASVVAAMLSAGTAIFYVHADHPNGMTFVSTQGHDQNDVLHAIFDSAQEEGFQIVQESNQRDVIQFQKETDNPMVINVQVGQQEDSGYYEISCTQPRALVLQAKDVKGIMEAYQNLFNKIHAKLDRPESQRNIQNPAIEELNESVRNLGKSQT